MKQKISYALVIIVTFFLGVTGTIVTYKFIPGVVGTINETKNVSITETNTIKEAVDKIYNSVVVIETYTREQMSGSGTGFIYKTDDKYGYIITNHHVVDGGSVIKVTNNNKQEVEATVLGSDEYEDIAVLRIEKEAVMSVAEIGDSTSSVIGDTIFTVGSPLGIEYMGTVTKGILSGKNRSIEVELNGGGAYVMEVLQMDAAINPGNSGGPLVNINGQVIGVNSLKLVKDTIEGMGFAIPIEIVMSAVEYLEKGEAIKRPILGATLTDISNTYELFRNKILISDDIKNGVVILSVDEDYPAIKAGLKKGDVITAIDNTKVTGIAQFRTALYKYQVGDSITIKYNRDGKDQSVKIKLDRSV